MVLMPAALGSWGHPFQISAARSRNNLWLEVRTKKFSSPASSWFLFPLFFIVLFSLTEKNDHKWVIYRIVYRYTSHEMTLYHQRRTWDDRPAVVSLQVDKALVQHLIDLVNGGKILICLSVAWRWGWIAQNTELMGGSTRCIYIYT